MKNPSALLVAIALSICSLVWILLPAAPWLYSQWQQYQWQLRSASTFPVMTIIQYDVSFSFVDPRMNIVAAIFLGAIYLAGALLLIKASAQWWRRASTNP